MAARNGKTGGRYSILRDVDEFEVFRGNTPAMRKAFAAGICKWFLSIPFVSHAGVFNEPGDEREPTEGELEYNPYTPEYRCELKSYNNVVVFLHNPPVLPRKPEPFWFPAAEWSFWGSYDLFKLFGEEFINRLAEYSGELPTHGNPSLWVFVFDNLVISDPEYRALELRYWKSKRAFRHFMKTLRLYNPAKEEFAAQPQWQRAVTDSRKYYWVMQNGMLQPTLRKPELVGTLGRYGDEREYHHDGHRVHLPVWAHVGLATIRQAEAQGFQECEQCRPKRKFTK